MTDDIENAATQVIMTLDLPDDLKTAIGEISIAYGQLEFTLAMCIKRTDGHMEIEEALVLAESFSARLAKAESQFGIWYLDQRRETEFERLIEKAKQLAKRRHDVIHALWARNKDGDVRWLRDGYSRLIDLDELTRLRDEIFQVTGEINGTTRNDGLVTFDAETTAAASYKISGPWID